MSTLRLRGSGQLDVQKWRWLAIAFSAVVITLGAGAIWTRGVPLGIEFSGGTKVVTTFADAVGEEAIRSAIPGDSIVQRYGADGGNAFLIRLPQTSDDAVPRAGDDVVAALHRANLPSFEITESESIGPSIGADLRRKGTYATVASLAGITAYIAIRFRPAFAIGAAAATMHDVLVTFALLNLAGYDLTLNVVAAMLTITGYSVNDTIVTFDRVRENLRAAPRTPLGSIINLSVSQTLGRTIITGGTTLLSLLALYLFGGDALRGFAFAMIVGVVSGIYSTLFIASTIARLVIRA
jgi:preprotein translocase SecF subunit